MVKNDPIKIAILLPTLAYGGAEKLVLDELRILCKDERFNFEVILPFSKGPLYEEFKKLGIKIKNFNSSHDKIEMIITYLKIYKYLRKRKFDIIHLHTIYNPLVVLICKAAAFHKVYSTIHRYTKFTFTQTLSFHLPDKIIACGKKLANFLTRYVPEKKVFLLLNGIKEYNKVYDTKQLKKLKSDYEVQDNYPVVLSIGRLTKQKGYTYLIKSVSFLKNDYPKVKLLIAGDGELREELQKLIKELNLTGHVRLLGIVKNVFELFQISDIYVNSSLWEALPLTLLEAMSSKIPIVATNVSGNSEVIIDGQTGLLIKPKSEHEIAKAVKKIINNPTLDKKLAENAYKLFKEKYTIEKHCENLANLYLSVSS